MKRLLCAVTSLVALGAIATGCGTSEKAEDKAATSGGPVSVTDSRGKKIDLKEPARRVVALEWGEAEMLVTLGVMPVGVADIKNFAIWDTAVKIDAGVKDVGTRSEPSIDAIVALKPDLIVMEVEKDFALVEQLEKFVPVLVAKGSDATRNLERMREDFTMIATAVGKSTEAKKTLTELDGALAAAKTKIAAAGGANKPFVMADGWKEGSTISIRMFGQGSYVSQLAIQAGLKNAWTGKVDEAWGLGNTDVEGLSPLKDQDVRFLYSAPEDDVFADGLAGNAIWDSMTYVKTKQVHKLPNGIWTFGGPASSRQFIDQLVKVYAG
ncbi:ABC transporter substrate-binding protein [Longispora urticae]